MVGVTRRSVVVNTFRISRRRRSHSRRACTYSCCVTAELNLHHAYHASGSPSRGDKYQAHNGVNAWCSSIRQSHNRNTCRRGANVTVCDARFERIHHHDLLVTQPWQAPLP